jgi:hypothetical protein
MTSLAERTISLRRFGIYGLILTAFFFVSAVVFVLITEERVLTEEEAFPEAVILDAENSPEFGFPVAARSFDLSLNRFVDRFARVCREGKYSDFRMMLSSRHPPILPPRFESNFNALKRIKILDIEKMPTLPDSTGDVFVMSAEYELEDFAAKTGETVKQVQVAIAKEEGQWRLGPIPSEAVERLRAYRAQLATSQPGQDASPDAQPASATPDGKAVANRPARIGS